MTESGQPTRRRSPGLLVAVLASLASLTALTLAADAGGQGAGAAAALGSRAPTKSEFFNIQLAFEGDQRAGHDHAHDPITEIRITRGRPYVARVFFVASRFVKGQAGEPAERP